MTYLELQKDVEPEKDSTNPNDWITEETGSNKDSFFIYIRYLIVIKYDLLDLYCSSTGESMASNLLKGKMKRVVGFLYINHTLVSCNA